MILDGDCIGVMATLPADSIDSIVTDPPYNLSFMGKKWDTVANFQHWCEQWGTQALRVLKPGGHMLVMGSPRTFHRMISGLEDAGFEVRDCIMWLQGQGFPKNHDVSKSIDKLAGKTRKISGYRPQFPDGTRGATYAGQGTVGATGAMTSRSATVDGMVPVTEPATPEAKQWQGWGTALKPSWEPVVLVRKPFKGSVAKNVLAHGTGAINVDATRIGTETRTNQGMSSLGVMHDDDWKPRKVESVANGRWPANLVLSHHPECEQTGTRKVKTGTTVRRHKGISQKGSFAFGNRGTEADLIYADADGTETILAFNCHPDCAVLLLDQQAGELKSGAIGPLTRSDDSSPLFPVGKHLTFSAPANAGGASRFFYCAKASKSERGKDNKHPTVKPIALMRYLCRLITPPRGIILDPFTGSGTTGIAAKQEGFAFLGIELEDESIDTANARINATSNGGMIADARNRKRVKRIVGRKTHALGLIASARAKRQLAA